MALVVGNGTCTHIGRLPNPENDAADMAAALRRLGIEVTTENDAFPASPCCMSPPSTVSPIRESGRRRRMAGCSTVVVDRDPQASAAK